MKEAILQLIKEAGYDIKNILFIKNFDDSNEGYEFNPLPPVMITIKWTMGAKVSEGPYLYIEKRRIKTWDETLEFKRIIGGKVILQDNGKLANVYKYILKHWDQF